MVMKLRFDKRIGGYLVLVDGQEVGSVRSFQERTTHTSGRISIGYSYKTRWNAYNKTGRHVGFGSFRTRKDAAEWLLNNREEVC